MTREEARKAAEVMMAYADGKKIEYRHRDESEWRLLPKPRFYWDTTEYRIKQEPTYRPFISKEECWNEMQKHQPLGWVKDKGNIEYMDISRVGAEGIDGYDYSKMLKCFTFTDGTPFGIKEE